MQLVNKKLQTVLHPEDSFTVENLKELLHYEYYKALTRSLHKC